MAFTTRFAGTKKEIKQRFGNIFSRHSRLAGAGALCLSVAVLLTGTMGISVTAQGSGDTGIEEGMPLRALTMSSELYPENGVPQSWEQEHSNYELTPDERWFQWSEEYLSDMPNVTAMNAEQLSGVAEEGYLADITDLLRERGWTDKLDRDLLKMVSDEDGKIYGIPGYVYTYGLALNKELFREAGLADEDGEPIFPTTWEELARDAQLIKEKTEAAGLCLVSDEVLGAMQFDILAWDFGAEKLATYEGEKELDMGLASEEAIRAMEFVKDLKWKYDALTADPTKEDYNSGIRHLGDGTAAMYIMPSDMMSMLEFYEIDPEGIAFGALPEGADGKNYSYFGGSTIVFSADTSEEDIDVLLSLLEEEDRIPLAGSEKQQEIVEDLPENCGEWKAASAHYQTGLALTVVDVLHAVVTDPDADVKELMQQAESDWESSMQDQAAAE